METYRRGECFFLVSFIVRGDHLLQCQSQRHGTRQSKISLHTMVYLQRPAAVAAAATNRPNILPFVRLRWMLLLHLLFFFFFFFSCSTETGVLLLVEPSLQFELHRPLASDDLIYTVHAVIYIDAVTRSHTKYSQIHHHVHLKRQRKKNQLKLHEQYED